MKSRIGKIILVACCVLALCWSAYRILPVLPHFFARYENVGHLTVHKIFARPIVDIGEIDVNLVCTGPEPEYSVTLTTNSVLLLSFAEGDDDPRRNTLPRFNAGEGKVWVDLIMTDPGVFRQVGEQVPVTDVAPLTAGELRLAVKSRGYIPGTNIFPRLERPLSLYDDVMPAQDSQKYLIARDGYPLSEGLVVYNDHYIRYLTGTRDAPYGGHQIDLVYSVTEEGGRKTVQCHRDDFLSLVEPTWKWLEAVYGDDY